VFVFIRGAEKMKDIHIDAYSPAEMAQKVEKIGVSKAKNSFDKIFVLSFMAGVFIALGAEFFTLVVHDSSLSVGLTKLIGGVSFCLGLILVIVAGAELFTGNSLIIMAYVQKKINLYELLYNWFWVYIGNFLGSLFVVLLVVLAGQYSVNNYVLGVKAVNIAVSKVNLTFLEAFTRGILCNLLVALAVWLSFAGRSITDKILSILFPITAFVASGFEHCVANMYFIPVGIILSKISSVKTVLENGSINNLNMLTTKNFIFQNLIPVTLGNIVGGVVFVGIAYWFVYLREKDPGLI
jgi:formate/nitrite transporter